VAFFVNVDDPTLESWYGPTVKRALLAAVLDADQDRRVLFQAYSGNLLPLTYRVVNVEVSSSEAGGRFVDDFSARFVILCELCDAASESWCTLDQIQAPWMLYSRNIYIILVSAMTESVRQMVDQSLYEVSWYLGAMEVDRGNPIQQWLFGESLIPTWFHRNGWVGLDEEEDDAEPPARLFRGIKADGFGWTGVRSELLPPPPIAWGPMSVRGERSASVLIAASRRTHNEQIAAQVFEIFLHSTVKGSPRDNLDIPGSARPGEWDATLAK
jgi:hypothetical protein